MKQKLLTFFTATLLFASCNNEKTEKTEAENATSNTASADAPKEEAWVPVDTAIMMQKMMEYGTPGPMHQMLASWNGTWSGETTVWEYEGAAPQKSTGSSVSTMILGGKYQSSKHSGNMMGMPFEGTSVTGYDNATKKFNSTWIDNWSTGIMTMTGTWDEASKTLTMSGTYPDIFRPGKECKMKEVYKIIDENTHHMEMYGPDQKTGKEFKMMEMKMTRKK